MKITFLKITFIFNFKFINKGEKRKFLNLLSDMWLPYIKRYIDRCISIYDTAIVMLQW